MVVNLKKKLEDVGVGHFGVSTLVRFLCFKTKLGGFYDVFFFLTA